MCEFKLNTTRNCNETSVLASALIKIHACRGWIVAENVETPKGSLAKYFGGALFAGDVLKFQRDFIAS